jgi:PKD domain-containing protein
MNHAKTLTTILATACTAASCTAQPPLASTPSVAQQPAQPPKTPAIVVTIQVNDRVRAGAANLWTISATGPGQLGTLRLDFGDGVVVVLGQPSQSQSGSGVFAYSAVVSHVFNRTGTYVVTATVTSASSETSSASVTIDVE